MPDSSQHRSYQKRKRIKGQLKSKNKEEKDTEKVKKPKAKKAVSKRHPTRHNLKL